ncbi:hydrolase 1, exosortase A system-associated [Massilia sp. CCM 8733]|uniref:Hydrolase 1, exosortase A system-associated n=1 Tax=Massilia mucilaginosa TaxID=2609282 RepID=A0ABX0NZT9_9BURK|nr:hydrolase 1, exosortase A system-associated [Massilia mucilaginosa]NHZ92470.1 hydrolase 1, exosortase A system-associated [Massilia mucilaginosa]
MFAEQRALQFTCQGNSLIGILDLPERPLARGVLVVTSGPQYRIGHHRHFTLLARVLAGRGIPVLRFDHRGMGDSEGEARTIDALGDDIHAATRAFFAQVPEMRELVLWGLGDAAMAALRYAQADQRVSGVVLLNPWVAPREGEAVAAPGALPQRVLAGLAGFDGAALVILGGGDPAAQQLPALVARHELRCKCVTIAGAGRTFASRAWRDEVAEVSANWIASW